MSHHISTTTHSLCSFEDRPSLFESTQMLRQRLNSSHSFQSIAYATSNIMSSAPNGSGSSSDLDDDEFLRLRTLDAQGDEEDSEDQPSPSSSDERRETTIVQNLASAAAAGGTSTDDNDTVLAVVDVHSSPVHDIEEDRLAHQYHQSDANDDHSRCGGTSSTPLQQATPSHASTTSHNTTTDDNTLSQALMNQVREYNRLHQAHRQQQTSETAGAEHIMVANDEDRSAHIQTADHDIQTSLRDLILESSEHKSDTNTIGNAHDLEDEGNRDRDKSVDIDQDILNAQEREYERLQQRRIQSEQEMERQAHWQHAFDRLFPMCNIDGKGRGRFVQNFHLATSTQTDVNTCLMVCASCNAKLYTSPTAVLSFCPICRNITTSIQEGKTPE